MTTGNLGLRERKKAQTKQLLISKALDLFSVHGVDKIGMRKLASESGLGLGTYYNYFKSKDEIIFAIFNSIFADVFAQDLIGENTKSLKADLKTITLNALTEVSKHKNVLLHFVQAVSDPRHYQGEETMAYRITQTGITSLWKHLNEAIDYHKAALTEVQLLHLPRFFWHQFITYLYMCTLTQASDEQGFTTYIDTALETICTGIEV